VVSKNLWGTPVIRRANALQLQTESGAGICDSDLCPAPKFKYGDGLITTLR
jgi:hypothetical protein